ncbi:MAG: 50S ribosomal protein L19 [FCB group bacterium]|nr:50S ribosomal protein L19 [FCB group bacterium]
MDDIIRSVESEHMREDIPEFGSGDTLRVHVQVTEGVKVRTQIFEGVVISRKGKGLSETFMLRKISNNIGVERIFPLHSPLIEKIEVIRLGKVRRAKLFYLRDKKGKAARTKERRTYGKK